MHIETLRFIVTAPKGRRFSVNLTERTVNYRDLSDSRTGVAVSPAQAAALDVARKAIEKILTDLAVPAGRASDGAGKPAGAATRAPTAKPTKKAAPAKKAQAKPAKPAKPAKRVTRG